MQPSGCVNTHLSGPTGSSNTTTLFLLALRLAAAFTSSCHSRTLPLYQAVLRAYGKNYLSWCLYHNADSRDIYGSKCNCYSVFIKEVDRNARKGHKSQRAEKPASKYPLQVYQFPICTSGGIIGTTAAHADNNPLERKYSLSLICGMLV